MNGKTHSVILRAELTLHWTFAHGFDKMKQ